jgi:nitroreductase
MDRPLPRRRYADRSSGSSIYPAVQNRLVAARALGLGATLTTLYLQFEKEPETAFGLPPGVHSYALLPIGYPMGHFIRVHRPRDTGIWVAQTSWAPDVSSAFDQVKTALLQSSEANTF